MRFPALRAACSSLLLCGSLALSLPARAEIDPIMAAATATSADQIPDVSQTQVMTARDPVSQFVNGEFDVRQQLLTQWPGDAGQFEQLIAALQADELYRDTQGRALILRADQVSDFATGQPVNADINTLESISLNNALRNTLASVQARTQLNSAQTEIRRQAAQTLNENPLDADRALIQTRLGVETDPTVRELLVTVLARQDLESGDPARELSGAQALAGSNQPEVLALLQERMQQPALSSQLKTALVTSRDAVQGRIQRAEWAGNLFSGISMGSILLLAALGLAITYGLLGVINMAHGELIMIGAYVTYLTQGLFTRLLPAAQDWYLLAALPAAFIITALIGMVIERLVIKPLYGRQLETLLATFGVSLILMQGIRMLFGAQNVEVANPSWMSGGIVLSPALTLPYSRLAIIAFTLLVLGLVAYLIHKTRLGLFIRAVTQNRTMARAVGVPSARIDMLAFGLGSGLAGLAGCALSQIGNVGPDLGQTYIIDTFLVVVVGGVGQLMGAVLAAFGLGIGGKMLEVGMGAVLAKILLLVLIILFIQKRPQGLFALKGRFVD